MTVMERYVTAIERYVTAIERYVTAIERYVTVFIHDMSCFNIFLVTRHTI